MAIIQLPEIHLISRKVVCFVFVFFFLVFIDFTSSTVGVTIVRCTGNLGISSCTTGPELQVGL